MLRRRISLAGYQPAGRLWLAALSRLILRRRRGEIFMVMPAILLAWHRRLVTRKRDYASRRRPGRPPATAAIGKLVIRIAAQNPAWGHRRVQGGLVRLGHPIAASAVWQILHDAGIDPAPRRSGPACKQVLTARARGITAADFARAGTVPLRRLCALIVTGHGTRRARLAGITASPDGARMAPAARNLLTDPGHRANTVKFLIRDRAGQFTSSSGAVYAAQGIRIPASPPQAPRANAICERFTATLRRELPGRLPIVNDHHLRPVPADYLRHYHTARPHRAPGQLTPRSSWQPAPGSGQPRRAPDPQEAGPRRARPRIQHHRITAHRKPKSDFRAPQGKYLPRFR